MKGYLIELQNSRGEWNRPDLPIYIKCSFAISQGHKLVKNHFTRACGYRVVNRANGDIEYEEIMRAA